MTVREFVDLPSARVSYLDFRPDDPPAGTVVLLHGGGTDNAALSWGAVGPRLAAGGFRVVAPDHPGCGASPLPDWRVTQQRLVAYVGEFVDALGLDRYAIGGLSLGGGLTIGHVLARPQRVAGAVLLDSYGLMPRLPGGRQVLAWAMQRTGALDLATRAMATNSAALAWSLKSLIRDPAQRTPELVAEIVAAARQPGFTAFEQWQRNEMLWNRLRTDYTKRLADIARPVLIVHGDRDVGVPVARARAAAALIPHAELKVIAGAGHWVQRDQPEAVVAVMTDFLRRVLAS
ncbi:alpha/beta fold hydrolase [Mycolicibacter hiberniae]|uniref:Alpha/beta hydrolase n=1 Tax=Mycolicibacter hiberniae TaxID=29314 RepID=A0A7I7X1R5_9MYCO|nr:alpha/beta hydrolase [Mycolicibacter hiberniae]MCV7087897.1 alpha/beta hydrolase [Mycolicibacter hiberniae]ORV66292.1 alpha/beta hydrolase [Mycolicibacter hiberniae]BBZ23636.1 alpha/beta hydrolase [Mycolicibacter hiberniae]